MFAITGITGKVGSSVGRNLLAAGKKVRAVVRNEARAGEWAERGCEISQADVTDVNALRRAFAGTEGVFVLLPTPIDPSPGFPESRQMITALRQALEAARPARVVCLSTIGAQATHTSLLTQLQILEGTLETLPLPVAFLRAAWFMENFLWDVEPARETGVIPSFLQPLDKPFSMVATEDIGRTAATLLGESWEGRRIVELEGPKRVTPNEVAATFARVLGRTVHAEAVPRDQWEHLFRSQGMKNPEPRIQMLDGLNHGWIAFESGEAHTLKGTTTLETVLRSLVQRGAAGAGR